MKPSSHKIRASSAQTLMSAISFRIKRNATPGNILARSIPINIVSSVRYHNELFIKEAER